MKLNNLSRLTALLMAMMMLCVCSAGAESGIDWSNLTGSLLADTDAATALIEAGYCSLCVEEMAKVGITTWPATSFVCLHTQLANLSAGEAYDMLYPLYEAKDWLYDAYINAHEAHVTTATEEYKREAAICCDGCSEFTGYKVPLPGPSHTQGVCPWYQETLYVPTTPVVTDKDISKPDVLKDLTMVTLTFTATGENLTYTWQSTVTPDVENSWVRVTNDSNTADNAYTLTIDPAALCNAYRCVVTDSNGAVVSTSSTLYLGGKEFFAWATSTERDDTSVAAWLSATGVTMEYALAAYAGSLKGILLTDAIYMDVTVGLKELYGLTTLATYDADTGYLTDVRYHIAVAVYDPTAKTITPLTTAATN